MKCPICEVDLAMTDRQGVEIDYCPKCRGIWLDRGELDKLIEKSQQSSPQAMPVQNQSQPLYQPQYPQQNYRDDHHHDGYGYKKRKKGGLLGEIFDF